MEQPASGLHASRASPESVSAQAQLPRLRCCVAQPVSNHEHLVQPCRAQGGGCEAAKHEHAAATFQSGHAASKLNVQGEHACLYGAPGQ